MKPINCVIIEDEQAAARRLERLLKHEDLNCLAKLASVEEAVDWFANHQYPELLFLDIQLGDGLSFEIFEKVKVNASVIFTTAFDDYALRAFKLNSIDYLLKPIDQFELHTAVEKFKNQQLNKQVNLQQLQAFLQNQIQQNQYKDRFSVWVGKHLKSYTVQEIELFYSQNKATYLRNTDARSYLIDAALDQLEIELNPKQFFRISRKHIVKHSAIKEILSYSNSRLVLKLHRDLDELLIVSRERVKDFKAWLG
ncbi:LytR/AlgR family response regulator transcription factor [Psychroflexus salis]|uniref:DNA-binding response regulator n=1 Tax=Psychroflexus salis TaxID=1526574 RepID=A0A916ZRF5_9FLAO|nr:LytTR family DNA-binding domain-containing protein [Psychroflexus salis]GGE10468.1 DNA-binding response regulator [Psychroflexus salis]